MPRSAVDAARQAAARGGSLPPGVRVLLERALAMALRRYVLGSEALSDRELIALVARAEDTRDDDVA